MADSSNGAVVSTFTTDADGWNIEGDVQSFGWQATAGDPGGNLQWVDAASGADSYWTAGSQFLGDDTAYYGGSLSYAIEDSGSSYGGVPDVELIGDGMTLVAAVGQPGTGWTSETIALGLSGGWKVGSLSGATATAGQIKAVLANLTQMLIRAEFVSGPENGGLDNVLMRTRAAAKTKIWLDGSDAWSTAADWTGGSAPVSGNSVLVTEGDPQITANVLLRASFTEGADATVTLAGGVLTLTGPASLSGVVNGTKTLFAKGTTAVSGLTVGGTVLFENTGALIQTGGLTVGDGSGSPARLLNTLGATYTIADDSGIARGTSTASSISNAGTLQKTGGTGTSTIAPAVTNTGTIAVSSGTLDLQGAVKGAGAMTIGDNAILELDASVVATQTVTFTGASDALLLTDAGGFKGTVAGLDGTSAIDLANFAAGTARLRYTANSADSGGTLVVVSGANRAAIVLDGQFVQSGFQANAFSNGTLTGTAITYSPPALAAGHPGVSQT